MSNPASLLGTLVLLVSTVLSAGSIGDTTTMTYGAEPALKPQGLYLVGIAMLAAQYAPYLTNYLPTDTIEPVSTEGDDEVITEYGPYNLRAGMPQESSEPEFLSGESDLYNAFKEKQKEEEGYEFVIAVPIKSEFSELSLEYVPQNNEEDPVTRFAPKEEEDDPESIDYFEDGDAVAESDIRFQDWHANFQRETDQSDNSDNRTTINTSLSYPSEVFNFIVHCPTENEKSEDKGEQKSEGKDDSGSARHCTAEVDGITFECLAANNEEAERYLCPSCDHILKDAVQINCGHWMCEKCASDLFSTDATKHYCKKSGCQDEVTPSEGKYYFPDRFVRRCLAAFKFSCTNDGCEWQGTLSETQTHASSCKFKKEACSWVLYGCNKKFTNAEEKKQHEDDPQAHLSIIAREFPKIKAHIEQCESIQGNKKTASPPATEACRCSCSVHSGSGGASSSDSKLLAENDYLFDQVMKLETTVENLKSGTEDRDFRLSLMENSNFDGTMVWKIPEFSRRTEDARTGKYTSIFSLPFFSSRYGYKMCLRLYILGDGIGKGTHMSLFFVLMKGEFDSLLEWPFTHKVTLKIFNQGGAKHVMDIFQPDPLSSSFQKPKSDMNVASGCPRFISMKELRNDGFIKNDTIFIKVKVDTTTIRHP